MRVDHTLGQACGAGGIHDEQVFVAARGHIGLHAGGFAQQIVQFRVRALSLANLYPGLDGQGVLIVGLDADGKLGALRAVKQGFGATIGKNERQFTGCESGIQWHHHDAEFRRPIKQCDELHAVLHQQCQPIPRLQAAACNDAGAAVAERIHLGVTQASVGGGFNIVFQVRRKTCALAQVVAEIDFHINSSLSNDSVCQGCSF